MRAGVLIHRLTQRPAERGHTLPEVLVASTVMVVVLGATLAVLDYVHRPARQNQLTNEAQDRARIATDRLARELRNLASPTEDQPNAVETADPDELVFRTVDQDRTAGSQNDENVRRVRYCYDPDPGRIVVQSQTWQSSVPPPAPAGADCPDPAAWGGHQVMVDHVVNDNTDDDRPVWLYNADVGSEITSIRTQLFVDADPATPPAETSLVTGVLLRNQNRAPVASIAAPTPVAGGAFRFNGSASTDPEGGVLAFSWSIDGQPAPSGPSKNVTFDWTPPGPGSYAVRLKVTDSSGLPDEETWQLEVSS